MTADYLIIGQGLCGTWLSYYLLKADASVVMVDSGTGRSASGVASGIINPVTGKRLARQWMADTILPFASKAYTAMSHDTGTALATEMSIHNFFASAEEAEFFENKAAAASDDLLTYQRMTAHATHFSYHYGIGTIYPALLVDVRVLLKSWRERLVAQGALCEDTFSWADFRLQDGAITWKGHSAKAAIDCTGAWAVSHPYFSNLPFALNRGEALIASIPGLSRDAIYKHGPLSIVPWEKDTFWIGSTFDWDHPEAVPTAAFREKALRTLEGWLRLPFIILEHFAAVRPATVTRDAFSGLHPKFPQLGILNGMGSKGCALAPFLAHNLAAHLVHGAPLIAQVDVARYARVLGR